MGIKHSGYKRDNKATDQAKSFLRRKILRGKILTNSDIHEAIERFSDDEIKVNTKEIWKFADLQKLLHKEN